jgi:hypothetical protein
MLTFWAQFIVMFRSRFSDHFPTKLAHIGPQDLERGVQQDIPTKEVEGTLCALLGLVLNRKKPVEYVHPTEQQSDETCARNNRAVRLLKINTNILKAWTLWSRTRGSSVKSQIAMASEMAGPQPTPRRSGLQQHVS